jgi:superoxide dismutase, Cu-Zn family
MQIVRATPFVAGILLLACGDSARRNAGSDTDPPGAIHTNPSADPGGTEITAPMRNAAGKDLGTLVLTERDAGITATGRLNGLPPGVHGIHLHTTGRCDPPKFQSAGDHWNPTSKAHGTKDPGGPHLGDFPNITVADDGSVVVLAKTRGGTLRGENSLLDSDGAAVVVHAKPDDYRTQPSGDSGDRIACGVVSGR